MALRHGSGQCLLQNTRYENVVVVIKVFWIHYVLNTVCLSFVQYNIMVI